MGGQEVEVGFGRNRECLLWKITDCRGCLCQAWQCVFQVSMVGFYDGWKYILQWGDDTKTTKGSDTPINPNHTT
jgi:hypothetical protein